jgi:hypothetical protein
MERNAIHRVSGAYLMDKALVLFAILALVAGFCWRAGRLAKRAVQGHPDADELESALIAPVRFLALLLAPSMTLAVSLSSQDAELGMSTGGPASAGAAVVRPETHGSGIVAGDAAVGIAALFGGPADRQVASVLALDCALMAARFALAYRARRGRWERAGRG